MDSNNLHGYYGRAGAPSAASTANGTPTHRPTTPTESLGGGRNPFSDGVESQASHRSRHAHNPFASPAGSRPASSLESGSALGNRFDERAMRYFHTRRVRKGEVEKPWMKKRDPKEKWVTILPLLGIFIGLCVSGFLVWDGIRSVVKHKYCLVLDDNFSGGLRDSIWQKEVEVGGFGNGEFEMTTGGDENVFVQNGKLVIKATLQDETVMKQDNVIDLIKDGTCTSTVPANCIAETNTAPGNASVVPPTKSGRINTKKGATIKFGRVEVTAKLPQGDWLWPAIWMLPVDDTKYGPWPQSGEIDIVESRGNDWTYAQGGNNIASSALHWGPNAANDAWWRTNNKRQALKSTYSSGFNTFGLEWSQKYVFTYINSRLLQVLYTNFDTPLWQRGNFPQSTVNGSRIDNPWASGTVAAPFDEKFYLIINLAVGGTNGWFEDNKSGKTWLNGSPNAKKDFFDSRDTWFPTWTQPQIEVSRVVMWQQCDGNEGEL